MTAKGPGKLDLYDKKTEKRPTHAAWQDKLVSTKAGDQDLMILTGKASFVDDDHAQTLQADTLKVWLAPSDAAPANATPAAPQEVGAAAQPRRGRRQRLRQVAANDHPPRRPTRRLVPRRSRRRTAAGRSGRQGRREGQGRRPAGRQDAGGRPGAARETAKPAKPDPSAPPPPPPGATAGTAPNPAKADAEPPRPIDLTARSVYAWVARGKEKSALESLQAEGDVHVTQAPAKADEKGVDVKGAALDMTPHPEGNFLVVEGDLAQLLMDKIYIIGPVINIDQAANKAWVEGPGAMQMESRTNFQGESLAKAVPMTIHWNDEMFFTGKHAEFRKGVQAEQDNSRLACKELSVLFDHAISLKEGNHDGPPPRVKKLVCYEGVRVEDRTLEGDRVISYHRLVSPSLVMDALEPEEAGPKPAAGSDGNEVHAPGPGDLRMFQRGAADEDPTGPPRPAAAKAEAAKPVAGAKPAAAPKAGAAAKADLPMKLTYINFHGSMYANSKTNRAVFLESVRVLDMPCENPNIEIDLDAMLDHLPEGAMYLRGDRLDVYDRGDKTKSQKEMIAKGNVTAQSREFTAQSDVMTYNEAKDQIIFEGGPGGVARLNKMKQRGGEPQIVEGKKIIYIRSTGRFSIDGGDFISGQ